MLDDEDEVGSARCRKPVRAGAMRLWTTRERLRTLARAQAPAGRAREPALPLAEAPPPQTADRVARGPSPATFRYDTVTRADAVCPACWERLNAGAALDGPERMRVWLTLMLFVLIAALLVWGVPTLTPNLLAAFWRNGAGGR